MENVQKVAAYIINKDNQLLVFEHVDIEDAGVQVPAGTVEEGTLLENIQREILEETGLDVNAFSDSTYLGSHHYVDAAKDQNHERHYFVCRLNDDFNQDSWVHHVQSNGEDHGLTFKYYFIKLSEADCLSADFNQAIYRLDYYKTI